MVAKNFTPTGIRSRDHPALVGFLDRLRYRDPHFPHVKGFKNKRITQAPLKGMNTKERGTFKQQYSHVFSSFERFT
jgi:hypothetical protein